MTGFRFRNTSPSCFPSPMKSLIEVFRFFVFEGFGRAKLNSEFSNVAQNRRLGVARCRTPQNPGQECSVLQLAPVCGSRANCNQTGQWNQMRNTRTKNGES